MRRRDCLVAGAGAIAATLLTDGEVIAASGFANDLVIAFDGLDYPSWSGKTLSQGLMAFLPFSVPATETPVTVTMSLLQSPNGVVPVKQGSQFDSYRSNVLSGTATDWAVLDRANGTVTLFIPYACIETSNLLAQNLFKLYFRIVGKASGHLKQHDRAIDVRASFEPDGYMIQRMVTPAPTEGSTPAEYLSPVFRGSFSSGIWIDGLGRNP